MQFIPCLPSEYNKPWYRLLLYVWCSNKISLCIDNNVSSSPVVLLMGMGLLLLSSWLQNLTKDCINWKLMWVYMYVEDYLAEVGSILSKLSEQASCRLKFNKVWCSLWLATCIVNATCNRVPKCDVFILQIFPLEPLNLIMRYTDSSSKNMGKISNR